MSDTFTAKAEESLHKVIEAFRLGEIAERCALATFPCPDIPAAAWSLNNRWLALIQSGEADCRGFRQWEEAGRKVRKGARAVYIFRPRVKKTGEGDDEKIVCTGFSPLAVFAVSSTEGEPLTYEAPSIPELPLMNVALAWGVQIKAQPFTKRFYGTFDGARKTITLCSPEVGVFLHELCHAAHSKIKGPLKGGQDPMQEIVAELGAEVLRRLLGSEKDTSGLSYAYIESYAVRMKQSILTACLKALRETADVVALILKVASELDTETPRQDWAREEEACVIT